MTQDETQEQIEKKKEELQAEVINKNNFTVLLSAYKVTLGPDISDFICGVTLYPERFI